MSTSSIAPTSPSAAATLAASQATLSDKPGSLPDARVRARRATRGRRAGQYSSVGRRRPGPVWLFDLDNTLHHASHAIFPFINREMTAYIERTLNVDRATANDMRVRYTRLYGAALLGLVRRNHIDAHEFLREVHPGADLPSLVRFERGLVQTLKHLPGRRVVLTNAPEQYARTVLSVMGIERLFERVVAIEQMRRGPRWHAKPDSAVIRRTLRQLGRNVRDAVLVEDTHSHLKRYRRMGIRTVWVTGHLPQRRVGTPLQVDGNGNGTTWTVPRVSRGRPHYVDRRVHSINALRRAGR